MNLNDAIREHYPFALGYVLKNMRGLHVNDLEWLESYVLWRLKCALERHVPKRSIRGWIVSNLKHAFSDYMNRNNVGQYHDKKPTPTIELFEMRDEEPGIPKMYSAVDYNEPGQALEQEDIWIVVKKFVTPHELDVLILLFKDGLTPREAGRVLKIRSQSVTNIKRAALNKLKKGMPPMVATTISVPFRTEQRTPLDKHQRSRLWGGLTTRQRRKLNAI